MAVALRQLTSTTDDVRESLLALLQAHATQAGHPFTPEDVALVLEANGQVAGGLVGRTNYGWLRIEYLAVDPALRLEGWGTRLVREAETLARSRGCRASWVDTFGYQAPAFYRRLGYTVFGELADYPEGSARHFLWKRLAPSNASDL